MPYRFRLTIGHVMGFIAVSALLMANVSFVMNGNYRLTTLIGAAIESVVLGVFLYNSRLSAWMWACIVGHGGQLLWLVLANLVDVLVRAPLYSNHIIIAINLTVRLLLSLLFALGVAMTFRGIRRRLAIYENAPSSEAQGSIAPSD